MVLRLLTAAIVVFSYHEIKTGLPLLTASIPTHQGRTMPVAEVIGVNLWVNLGLQILMIALLLAVPYIGQAFPGAVHFGSRRLSDYPAAQRVRVMPILRQMVGLLALLVSACFAVRNHLWLQSASTQGSVLPADWLKHEIMTEVEFIVALLAGFGLLTFYYLGRMDAAAAEESPGGDDENEPQT